MLKNGNKTNCGFADEIVSYIYDEIGAKERAKFETHLAGCSVCTDEFAAVSEARFSMFEWRREAFDSLPTPEIVIPYEPATRADVEEGAPDGLLAGLRGWLAAVKFPVAVAAGLVVCLGLGFLLMTYLGGGEQQIASNTDVPPVGMPKIDETKIPEVAVTKVKTKSTEVRPIKAVVRAQPSAPKHVFATNLRNRNSMPAVPNAPVLNNFEADDDNSLRLADLVADIDS